MKEYFRQLSEKSDAVFKVVLHFLKTHSQALAIFSVLVLGISSIGSWYYYESNKANENSKLPNSGNKNLIASVSEAQLINHQVSKGKSSANIGNGESNSDSDIIKESINDSISDDYEEDSAKENINYPKVLISEVQISGNENQKEWFIELYNPTDADIDLTGWYIHRMTKTGSNYQTFASKNLFSGKTIVANSYFLISRSSYFNSLADIFVDSSLTLDNSLVLKNPDGEISDKIGWGQSQDYETASAQNPKAGQSIGRNVDQPDTDNNKADFDLNSPTPKSSNKFYVAPPPPEPPIVSPEPEPDEPSDSATPSNDETEPLPEEETIQPVILINEIQIDGADDEKEEFIELYNPTDADIDLTGWYIHRMTKTGSNYQTFAANALFSGKVILSKQYLLIARTGYFIDLADIFVNNPLTNDNSLVLKNSNGEIVDKVGWGQAQDYEISPVQNPEKGNSVERKSFSDTGNNAEDLQILDIPTPKN